MSKKDGQNKDEGKKLVPGVGADVGTANIVVTRRFEDGSFSVKHHRNMLFEMEVSDESTDLLERSSFLYMKVGGKYYIVGDDALKLVNAIGRGDITRPMQNGLLNPSLKKAQEMLFYILKTILGDPIVENEPLRVSIPANPVDKPEMNNTFHQMVLESFFSRLGYAPKAINEALANLYSQAPSMTIDGEERALSGMSISCGAGMVNSCVAFKGLSVCEFSLTRSGDHIDRQTSGVTGESVSRVMSIKEKNLDLSKDNSENNVLQALSIYYDEFIKRVFSAMGKELISKGVSMDAPVPIVICGGTAMAPGFIERVKSVLKSVELPFEVKDVILSNDPFYSVSQGCCLAAIGDSKRSQASPQKEG